MSFVIDCDDQAEVDRLWQALTAGGGQPGPCGWLKDRFGLSWQIVPRRLGELVNDPDPERARRAMEAMLKMGKSRSPSWSAPQPPPKPGMATDVVILGAGVLG